MANKKNIHVVPSGPRWQVKQEGVAKPLSTHNTQAAADKAGRPLARESKGEIITHGRDGQIRDKDSFGRDPSPPKDKKH